MNHKSSADLEQFRDCFSFASREWTVEMSLWGQEDGSFHEQAASQLNLIFQSTCALITERDRLMSQFGSRTSYFIVHHHHRPCPSTRPDHQAKVIVSCLPSRKTKTFKLDFPIHVQFIPRRLFNSFQFLLILSLTRRLLVTGMKSFASTKWQFRKDMFRLKEEDNQSVQTASRDSPGRKDFNCYCETSATRARKLFPRFISLLCLVRFCAISLPALLFVFFFGITPLKSMIAVDLIKRRLQGKCVIDGRRVQEVRDKSLCVHKYLARCYLDFRLSFYLIKNFLPLTFSVPQKFS